LASCPQVKSPISDTQIISFISTDLMITAGFGKWVSIFKGHKRTKAMIDPALAFINADGYFLLKARKPKQTN
jgi:hypothetical protein